MGGNGSKDKHNDATGSSATAVAPTTGPKVIDAAKDKADTGQTDEAVDKLKDLCLEDKEAQRYNKVTVSEMYYPAGVDLSHGSQTSKHFTFETEARQVNCAKCKAALGIIRSLPNERMWCVGCLKQMYFGGKRGALLPQDIIMTIMCYCQDYHHLAQWSRVSHTWFGAANYDYTEENALTAVKRLLISREIYVQRKACTKAYSAKPAHAGQLPARQLHLSDFERRMRLGPIIGDWMDETTTIERRMKLAKIMAVEPFYVESHQLKELNLMNCKEQWADGETRRVLHVTSSGTYNKNQNGAMWIYGPQGSEDPYICFTMRQDSPGPGGWMRFEFDRYTGLACKVQAVGSVSDPRPLSVRLGISKAKPSDQATK